MINPLVSTREGLPHHLGHFRGDARFAFEQQWLAVAKSLVSAQRGTGKSVLQSERAAYLSNLLLTVNVALGSSIHKTSDVSARDSHLLILCSLRPQPPFLFLEEGDKLA